MAIYRRPVSKRMFVKSRKTGKDARRVRSRVQSLANSVSSIRMPGIRRPDFGFPDRMVTKIRYVDNFTLTGAAGVVGANVFRFNGPYDPDYSGVGHQPMYFDQFAGATGTGPYSRYRVISAKATVSFMQTSPPAIAATNVGPIVVGLQTGATSGLYGTNVSALCEASGSTWTHLGDKSGGNNVKTLTATYYPRRDLGVAQDDDTVSAAYNGVPSQGFFCIPWKVDTVGAASVSALVEIVYTVEFFDRNEVAQS